MAATRWGRGNLNDLARAGQVFTQPAVGNSGTSARTSMVRMLQGGGLVDFGAVMASGEPMLAASAAAASALGPRLAQRLMNSGPGQAYLTTGIPGLNRPAGGTPDIMPSVAQMMAARLLQDQERVPGQ